MFLTGVALPQFFPDGEIDVDLAARFCTRAEELGFDGVWAMDELVGRVGANAILEPLGLLAYVAARTATIRLGVAVLVLPRHNPVALAKTVATLDWLSAGRMVLGVGLGDRSDVVPGIGMPHDRRALRLEEAIDVMRALWAEPRANYRGEFWHLDGVAMEPKPVQEPSVPIWIGAKAEAGLRRAARIGQGWIGAGATSTADFRNQIETVKREFDTIGRDPGSFTIAKRAYVVIDDDERRARAAMRAWTHELYADATIGDRVGIIGSAAQCAERLAELGEAGARYVLLHSVHDHEAQLEAFAEVRSLLS